jgi:hypothetical protein
LFLTLAANRKKLFGDRAAAHGTDRLEAVEDGQTLGFELLKGIPFPCQVPIPTSMTQAPGRS